MRLKLKLFLIFLVLLAYFYTCNDNYDYKKISKNKVESREMTLIIDSNNYKIYSVCKDYGAPVNNVCFAVIEKGGRYFKINPKYGYEVGNGSIYLFQTRTGMRYSEEGGWVLIESGCINGIDGIHYRYDTIPSGVMPPGDSKGVFYFHDNNLQKVGELTDFQSLYDLQKNGFYYLSPPGLFYEKVINIEQMK